jgi:hypothetical protein
MSFLIDDYNLNSDVKNGLLKGSNFISMEKTMLGNRLPKELNFKTLEVEWIKVSDWKKVCQNQICEPIPNVVSINNIASMFLMGGYLHGLDENTTVPEFDSNYYDNLLSDILGSSLTMLTNGDMGLAYAYLQTWLFFMNYYESKHIMKTSLGVIEQQVTSYSL